MIEKVKEQVYELLKNDNSGHGIDHINRVLDLSLKFAKEENANEEVVSLIALLHDVDDYKLFGEENAKELTNARKFLKSANIDNEVQKEVLESISTIGYSKRLKGISPNTLEGKIVSDADMCDAVGVSGILRTHQYSLKYNKPFFDKNIFPVDDMDGTKYKEKTADSSVCHVFEKLLKLKNLMLTESGKKEIESRHNITIDILYHLFEEENALEWIDYLDKYLKNML
mgnify:CR=1 FL=1